MNEKPKLRPLDFQPVMYMGEDMWLLRDPLRLSETQLIIPAPLAQMLLFLDGTRTPQEIHEDFSRMVGGRVDYGVIADALSQLDEACLLENGRSAEARAALLAEFRGQPFRPPALAGLSYPEEPEALTSLFAEYALGDNLNGWQPWEGRGIVSPHIDYQRGGPVYARVWRRAQQAALNADLVIIFGTDHSGGPGTVTLTRLPYATPFGVLPPDPDVVNKLAASLGEEAAFADELHHREEHSVELSAVWLHYLYRQAGVEPPPMVPILVGSFQHFVNNGSHPAADRRLNNLIRVLRQETAGRRVLAVASVDLAHVGPAFGDEFGMDAERRKVLHEADRQLMAAAVAGDAEGWYGRIAQVGDRNRICGFAPTYLLLRYLGQTSGQKIAYDQCPADPEDTSLVSICGLLLD